MDMSRSDSLTFDEVDLGLGQGLRPGSQPTVASSRSRYPSSSGATDLFAWSYDESNFSQGVEEQKVSEGTAVRSRMSGLLAKISDRFRLRSTDSKSESVTEVCSPYWSTSDNVVPLGTSLRQQRLLYEQQLDDIQRRRKIGSYVFHKQVEKSQTAQEDCRVEVRHLLNRLAESQLNVEILRQDLETYKSRLSSKEKAIHVLKQQSRFNSHQSPEDDARRKTELLVKELNAVQFELEHRKNSLHLSQQVWIERFNSVSQENVELKKVLERQSTVLKQLYEDKMLFCRERDELLTLINIHQHTSLENLSTFSHFTTDIKVNHDRKVSDEAVEELAMNKLAILGACMCSASTCQCALVAAQLAQDVSRLADELEEARSKHSVSMVTCDAYRIAFEEQLNCNRLLLKQLVNGKLLSKNSNKKRGSKMAEDSNVTQASSQVITQRSESLLSTILSSTPDEKESIVLSLIEMIADRSEALAHQRLATNLLAERTQHLEGQLSRHHINHAAFHQQVSASRDALSGSAGGSVADIFYDAAEDASRQFLEDSD